MCPEAMYYDAGADECMPCDNPLIPNQDRTACVCPAGTFNNTRPLKCFVNGFHPLESGLASGYACHSCDGLECIEKCDGDSFTISAGWTQHTDTLTATPIFKCRYDAACPGGTVPSQNKTDCADSYHPPLCGVCEKGYQQKNGRCEPCGETSALSGILVVVGVLLLLGIIAKFFTVLYNWITILQEIYELSKDMQLKAVGKICLALFQVIGAFSLALGVQFPAIFDNFVEGIMGFFRLDITSMISFGCVTSGAYITSLIGQVVVLLLLVAAVGIRYVIRQKKAKNETLGSNSEEARAHVKELFDRFDEDGNGIEPAEVAKILTELDPDTTEEDAAALFKAADSDGSGVIDFDEFFAAVHDHHSDPGQGLDLQKIVLKKQAWDIRDAATGQLFLVIFVLYPSFTNKIFEGFSCRSIGDDAAVLYIDYSLDCDSGTYTVLYISLLLLMVLWPIGVPAVLFWQMRGSKDLILAEDPDALQKFDFVLGDYKITHWYWEVVELGRKLLLTGIISMFGRGTILQVVLATCLSFFFFALSVKEQPYNAQHLNVVRDNILPSSSQPKLQSADVL